MSHVYMFESRHISMRPITCSTMNMDKVFLCMYTKRVMYDVNESVHMCETRHISTRHVTIGTINMDTGFLCMYIERVM